MLGGTQICKRRCRVGVGGELNKTQLNSTRSLTLIDVGRGCDTPAAQEIGCHFSDNGSNVVIIADFFKNDVGPKVKKSFWAYLE